MWIDDPNAQERIDSITNPTVREAVRDLSDIGFCVLRNAVTEEGCNSVINDFMSYCHSNPQEAEAAMLPEGHHSRLYNLHSISKSCLDLALTPIVLAILDEIFSAPTALNSTLYFEQGSEQSLHRDTPFFTAAPMPGEFAGVWFALEDVTPEAGPLMYVPGGHKFPVSLAAAKAAGEGIPARVSEMFSHYNSQIHASIQELGLETKTLLLKKGDVAIWHPELPHGGAPILEQQKSRHSVVAHYMPRGAYIQPVGYFFDLEPKSKIMEFMPAKNDRFMRWNEKPVFMPNN